MFHLLFALPSFYVIGRFLWPLPWPLPLKLATAAVLLSASQYHLYCRFSSGSVFSPEMPRGAVIFFNWAFSAILLLALLQIALDLVALASWLLRHPVLVPAGLRYAIGLGACVLAAVGVHQAIGVPAVKQVELRIRNLPPQFDGYTLLQLTDLHISRLFDASWAQEVVKRGNRLQPDLIVVTGDVIDGSIEHRRQDVEPLRALRARDGVYFIPGNHEYFFDATAWTRYLTTLGMIPLENTHTVLRRGDAALVIAGVTDLSAPEVGLPPPDLHAALRGVPPQAPIVLLDHQPRQARQAAAQGVDVQLSGHTHGGLILGVDRLFALANAGFVSGLYEVAGMQLYVNNGTALWPGLALRLGRPSELTRITLRRAPEPGALHQPSGNDR